MRPAHVTVGGSIVTCPDCGQRNRLPDVLKLGTLARCGQCQHTLMAHDDEDDDEDLDDEFDDEGGQA